MMMMSKLINLLASGNSWSKDTLCDWMHEVLNLLESMIAMA